MDEKNHDLQKSGLIGKTKADVQFNVVWKTPGPVKAKPWSPYIQGSAGKPDEACQKVSTSAVAPTQPGDWQLSDGDADATPKRQPGLRAALFFRS